MSRTRVGVSACLLGELTRYDGAHKLDPVVQDLAAELELYKVCPEVEAGLTTPREPMQVTRLGTGLRLLGVGTRRDHTPAIAALITRKLGELHALGIAGFVLKNRSPSCGLARVPIFDPTGVECGAGQGLFAAALQGDFPEMPIVEAEELQSPARRAAFLAAVAEYARRLD